MYIYLAPFFANYRDENQRTPSFYFLLRLWTCKVPRVKQIVNSATLRQNDSMTLPKKAIRITLLTRTNCRSFKNWGRKKFLPSSDVFRVDETKRKAVCTYSPPPHISQRSRTLKHLPHIIAGIKWITCKG